MVGGELYSILFEGFRTLFLIVVPMTVAVTLAGTLAGLLQTSTSIADVAIGYAFRLAAASIVLYLFFPAYSRSVMKLAELAFK